MKAIHEKYMHRCLELAQKGLGTTYPNPMVGSVIVYQNKIIGEGWHYQAGWPHAEVNAINSVKDRALLSKSTLYVNLEPCSHHGKTPPCADLIIKHQIPRVIIGSIDKNSAVNGKGIIKLQNHGCEVVVGVLEQECFELNKRFFTYHEKKRPYIILKWAQSKDGFIAPDSQKNNEQKPYWISNERSKQLVHQWRTEEQAILVGTRTVLHDNPKLTTRTYQGKSPVRIVIDRFLKVSNDYSVLDNTVTTYVYTEQEKDCDLKNLNYITIDFKTNVVTAICNHLYQTGIQSVIVEGGAVTLQRFIEQNLWDEARVFIGDLVMKEGLKAPEVNSACVADLYLQNDNLKTYKND